MKERGLLMTTQLVREVLAGRKTQTRRIVVDPPRHWSERMVMREGGGFDWAPTDYTRIMPSPVDGGGSYPGCFIWGVYPIGSTVPPRPSPYGIPGDRLWIREDHYRFGHWEPVAGVQTKGGRAKWRFVANRDDVLFDPPAGTRLGLSTKAPLTPAWYKRLGRFMPRALSRVTLEITAVRAERLQAISEDDARAEGCSGRDPEPAAEGGTIYAFHGRSSAPSPRAHFMHLWDRINGASAPWSSNVWVWVVGFRRLP